MIADLLRGRLPRLCQMPDGRLTPDGESPAVLVCGSFNPLHEGHRQLAVVASRKLGLPAAFEIGIVNADKPALEEVEVRWRLRQFEWLAPVWLTREPTFVGKARLFPNATFVVGTDTAERVTQPHYYVGDDAMQSAFEEIRSRQCRFLVAGRVNSCGDFVGAVSLALPADLFEGLTEAEFRADVSSTVIRMLR